MFIAVPSQSRSLHLTSSTECSCNPYLFEYKAFRCIVHKPFEDYGIKPPLMKKVLQTVVRQIKIYIDEKCCSCDEMEDCLLGAGEADPVVDYYDPVRRAQEIIMLEYKRKTIKKE